ncbi:MAG: flagellar export protein FliJ [Fimbriimonadales bacterium]
MRRFRFRLDRVLRYRESREEVAYRALQEAIRERVQHESRIQALHRQIQQIASEPTPPQEWKAREQSLNALQTRLQALYDLLPILVEQENRAREVYLQARQQREALTRLRTRAYEHYQNELQTALQNQMDEVVIYAYQRNLSENPPASGGDSEAG